MIKFISTAIRSARVRFCNRQFKSREAVALPVWESIKSKHDPNARFTNILAPVWRKSETYSGSNLILNDALNGLELGLWAIDSLTADCLWHYMESQHPSVILEFGSGSSTCVFAAWMKANNPNGIIVSVDQHDSEADKTNSLLRQHGLDTFAKVIAMPLRSDDRYDIDISRIQSLLNGRTVDVLFTDGPAGPDGCRDNTLTEVQDILSDGATWFLHDALRDGEMSILRKWESEGASPLGIIPIGMGLAVGKWNKKAQTT